MWEDDIDWMNAAADVGLVALCREMAALAKPFDAMPGSSRVRRRRHAQRRTPTAPARSLTSIALRR